MVSWIIIFDELFAFRWWVVIVFAAVYLIPIFRLISFPFKSGRRGTMTINRIAGMWEYFIIPARLFLVMPYLTGFAAWHVLRGIQTDASSDFAAAGTASALVAIGIAVIRLRRREHLKLIDFACQFPTIHPQEFFDHLLCISGLVRHSLPKTPFSQIDPSKMDFRLAKKKRRLGLVTLIAGIWSTVWIARLILRYGQTGRGEEIRKAAGALGVIWGARISQLARAAVTVEGREYIPPAGGSTIFVLTHGSFIDFALVPILLASRPRPENTASQSYSLPMFLMAKDHFRDNIFLYRFLGVGRVAEMLGMIFVERKKKDKTNAMRVTLAAADWLIRGSCDLAIFPQGSRAAPYIGQAGNRRDAAYYTVGSKLRIAGHGGHLKKGAAHIAIGAARELDKMKSPNSVAIVPVAIEGAATACPRASLSIQPNVSIRLHVGEPILVTGQFLNEENSSGGVWRLHAKIDSSLKELGHVHARLEQRFFEDIRWMLDSLKTEEISIAMKSWRGEDYLVYAILDAIYALKPDEWRPKLGELIHMLLNFAPREELLTFKSRIAAEI